MYLVPFLEELSLNIREFVAETNNRQKVIISSDKHLGNKISKGDIRINCHSIKSEMYFCGETFAGLIFAQTLL